jgi:hypothetical protein
MPSILGYISVAAALGSCGAAIWVAIFALRQIRGAEVLAQETRSQARSAQVGLVVHFAESYHAILEAGLEFSNKAQIEKFWGLHYLEFFYFARRDVPEQIYDLWMVELARLYHDEPLAWESHEKYLQRFQGSFMEMYTFFHKIKQISARYPNGIIARDREVLEMVTEWLASRSVDSKST